MLLFIVIATRILVAFLVVASILPLLSIGAWAVRLFDFPRLQLACMVIIPLIGLGSWYFLNGWSLEQTVLAGACGLVLFWQTWHIAKYSVLWPKELAYAGEAEADQDVVRVVVVNLQFDNPQKEAVRKRIAELDVDLILLIEIDQEWANALSEIEENYPYREGILKPKGLGLMLWSKLPLRDGEVRHLVSEDRPSIFATVDLANSEEINFVGVHPTPPGLEIRKEGEEGRHNSRIRDAELMLIARKIAEEKELNWIVTGDFNDVAWSHTTRLFKRISGLKDPRVGRGLFNSYHAQHVWMRCPIDQVFLSPGAKIVDLKRSVTPGSDHFAIATTFVARTLKPAEPEPVNNDLQDSRDIIEEGKEDAEKIDSKSDEPAP